MARRLPERLARSYRTALERIRAQIIARVVAEYDIDPDDIDGSIRRFAARVAPLVAGGQATVQSLARGFVRTSGLLTTGAVLELAETERLAGTTREGKPLLEGMAAWGPMVLGQIGEGRSVDEALEYGRYLAERFVDAELTGVVDRETAAQAADARIVAWEGTVSPTSCDPCAENRGRHELAEPFYRHPACHCTQVLVFG